MTQVAHPLTGTCGGGSRAVAVASATGGAARLRANPGNVTLGTGAGPNATLAAISRAM